MIAQAARRFEPSAAKLGESDAPVAVLHGGELRGMLTVSDFLYSILARPDREREPNAT